MSTQTTAVREVVVSGSAAGFAQTVVVGGHVFPADEPRVVGGTDSGPGPYDLLLAALGTCTSMTLRMYADRKGLPLDRVTLEVSHEKLHATDAAAADGGTGARVDRFSRVLHLEGDLDDDQRARLVEIADRCPVHRTLEQSSVIETTLAPSANP
jgi:putative redox protein